MVSAMVIVALHKYVAASSQQQYVFKPWSRAILYVCFRLAVRAFFISLAAALAAVGVCRNGIL